MNLHYSRGITLIELLIVVTIVGILAMVAVPAYQSSVQKSRRADARVALNSVAQRLERCYTQFGAYDADDCGIADGDTVTSPEGFYTVTVAIADAANYTLTADPEGAQADDTKCGSFEVTNTGLREASGTDPDHCW